MLSMCKQVPASRPADQQVSPSPAQQATLGTLLNTPGLTVPPGAQAASWQLPPSAKPVSFPAVQHPQHAGQQSSAHPGPITATLIHPSGPPSMPAAGRTTTLSAGPTQHAQRSPHAQTLQPVRTGAVGQASPRAGLQSMPTSPRVLDYSPMYTHTSCQNPSQQVRSCHLQSVCAACSASLLTPLHRRLPAASCGAWSEQWLQGSRPKPPSQPCSIHCIRCHASWALFGSGLEILEPAQLKARPGGRVDSSAVNARRPGSLRPGLLHPA